jgi:hypothetical protein
MSLPSRRSVEQHSGHACLRTQASPHASRALPPRSQTAMADSLVSYGFCRGKRKQCMGPPTHALPACTSPKLHYVLTNRWAPPYMQDSLAVHDVTPCMHDPGIFFGLPLWPCIWQIPSQRNSSTSFNPRFIKCVNLYVRCSMYFI